MNSITNVIAAISTPPGKGGVAVIRMSGVGAFEIAASVFVTKNGKKLEEVRPRVQIYGYIKDIDETVDDVLITFFPAPGSYTGEDTVEISCHGGILVSRTVLEVLLRNGAHPATAGEFTKRAYLNGRLTLSEAEGIGNLLSAESRDQMRLGSEPSRKILGERINDIRSRLVSIMSAVYARIDYPDEDLGELGDEDIVAMLTECERMTDSLLTTYRTGKAITEGIRATIVGKPNVGKSSFYNMLIGEESAIVTDIAGTTRDVLERSVPLGKVMLRLADTAGIRESDDMDAVERIGVARSREKLRNCELIFALFDISAPLDSEDYSLLELLKNENIPKIAVLNKCDKPSAFGEDGISGGFERVIHLSAQNPTAQSINELTEAVESLFIDGSISVGSDAVIYSDRMRSALLRASDLISTAKNAILEGIPQDAVSGDIERAIGAVAELDGRCVSEEIVADIFKNFCVGK